MKHFSLYLLLFFAPLVKSQSYDFTGIDDLLNNNSALFNGKVVCMIKKGDALIYYKVLGGIDSTSVSQIASATKTFSGALILRLAQENLFSLDDTIGRYKPNATLVGKGSSTIRQNFSHTAGWEGTTNYHSSPTLTLQQAADSIIKNDPQIYVPGTAFKYTGVSMHVAGAIAEQLAGIPWNTLFQNKIKIPLGLNNTTYCLTPNNPRIAGGVCSSPSDIMKFCRFILHDGKNQQGVQVVDSLYMQEMWKDQTNGVPQIASPYPPSPQYNNPYDDTNIGYGMGAWQDIYNPAQMYQEQISGAGAFGTNFWINRCTETTGVLFTVNPTNYASVNPIWFQIMDIVRNAIPNSCYTLSNNTVESHPNGISVSPNPTNHILNFSKDVAKAEVFTVLGIKIMTENNKAKIDISLLKNGTYFLKLTNADDSEKVIKIIKN